jgi:fructose-1-phosphate kinase PfkB-like protein
VYRRVFGSCCNVERHCGVVKQFEEQEMCAGGGGVNVAHLFERKKLSVLHEGQ